MKSKIFAWLKLIRLQFYPMAWIVYSLGAAAAYRSFGTFDSRAYWLGYLALFLTELCAVFLNEYYDLETDKLNKNAGLFNGGSRVLVNGEIGIRAVKISVAAILVSIFVLGYILVKISPGIHAFSILFLLLSGLILGAGYTMPPLKFCYRGMGEVTVGIMFSLYLILCGYIFQCGRWGDPLPWLVSIPLFFAILPAITLSGLPDARADRLAGKKTLAVRMGPAGAVKLSAVFVTLAAVSWALLFYFDVLNRWAVVTVPIVFFHAAVLLPVLSRLARSKDFNRRIDNIMLLTLSYIAWFGLIPLLSSVSRG